MQEINDVKDLQEEIGQKVTDVTLLFLDMSSSCTGYCIVKVDFVQSSATFLKAGAFWFDSSMSNQEKYHYIFKVVTDYFYIVDQVDYCVAEAYMVNTKKMMGAQIGPELHGVLQVALAEVGLKYKTILPQTWRSQLGIKATTTINAKGKKERDYKIPTQTFINTHTTVPLQIKSNVTKNLRTTPSDLYDAMAIAMGFLTKLNIKKLDLSKIQYQPDVT